MHTWPQVPPYEAAFRAQWPSGLPGRGDEATWPACTGHPNDPRTDNIEAEAAVYSELAEQSAKLVADLSEEDVRDILIGSPDSDKLAAMLQDETPDPVALTALIVRMRDEWADRVAARIVGAW